MIYSTVEVRWFELGSIPAGVADWFAEGAIEPAEQIARTDYYLQLPAEDALGIKLREGRLEIKKRQERYGAANFHDRAAGMVEGWQKWSFALAGDLPLSDGTLSGSWLAVRKARRLRKFAARVAGRVFEIQLDESASQGCYVELASLQVYQAEWWSVCLEAFGGQADLPGVLWAVGEQVFASHAAPRLALERSMGYPAFLGRAGKDDRHREAAADP